MKITWLLVTIWIILNAVDIAISWLGVRFGAKEVGLLYRLSGSWSSFAISKMVLALIIGGGLVYFRKQTWLVLLALGMAGLCIYCGWVFLIQILGGV